VQVNFDYTLTKTGTNFGEQAGMSG